MSEKNRIEEMDWRELPEGERMKYEVAKELGLLEMVREQGWKALSSKDTGRIGGIVAKRKKIKGNDAISL